MTTLTREQQRIVETMRRFVKLNRQQKIEPYTFAMWVEAFDPDEKAPEIGARWNAYDQGVLRAVCDIVDDAARDMHGVFYNAQSTLQAICDVTGRAAPDRVRYIVRYDDDEWRFADEQHARACAVAYGVTYEVLP